jgi:hypothetical protein
VRLWPSLGDHAVILDRSERDVHFLRELFDEPVVIFCRRCLQRHVRLSPRGVLGRRISGLPFLDQPVEAGNDFAGKGVVNSQFLVGQVINIRVLSCGNGNGRALTRPSRWELGSLQGDTQDFQREHG